MNFQLVNVHPLNPIKAKDPAFKESNYIGFAIEEDGNYFYWAKGVSIRIEQWEYQRVKSNPKLYYFSTALKLHFRIKKLKDAGLNND